MNSDSSKLGGFSFGSDIALSSKQKLEALDIIQSPTEPVMGALEGRVGISSGQITDVGSVVAKHYRRGGLLRLLVSNSHLKKASGSSRGEDEFRVLHEVAKLGIPVPTPVMFIDRGKILYKTWLVTKRLPPHRSLAKIALDNDLGSGELVATVCRHVTTLIDAKIFHVDLHPGNIIVTDEGQVFLLDFDKAVKSPLNPHGLRDQYIFRWRRAVIKHQLPDQLSEQFCACLRSFVAR